MIIPIFTDKKPSGHKTLNQTTFNIMSCNCSSLFQVFDVNFNIQIFITHIYIVLSI